MFTTRLHFKTLVEGELWQLEAPLRYEWTEEYEKLWLRRRHIIIPKGYVTDFYSIPKWSQKCWPKDIDPVHPAILHDYLYTHAQTKVSRVQADMLFHRAMRETGVPFLRRNLFYAAVRVGGKKEYYKRINRRIQYLRSLKIECRADGQPILKQ